MRPTWHYSAFGAHSRSFKNTIHAYLIYLTHVPYIMMVVHQTPLSCSLLICNHCSMEHPFIQHHHLYILNYTTLDFICQALNCIYLMFFPIVSLSSLSTLHQYRYTISIPTAIPAVNEPRQANAIAMNYLHPKYVP